MLREWVSSEYLGHQSLKNALNRIKRGIENVALSQVGLTVYPDTVSGVVNVGIGGFLRVGTVGGATNGTFIYRIEDTIYLKGSGITGALNTGDKTCKLIPGCTTGDNTATGGFDVTSTYYRAGVLLIDASGVWSVIMASSEAGKSLGISIGGRLGALRYLLDEVDSSDIEGKAIVAFYVIGDGANAFTSTSSLTIATNLDIYTLGGMTLATGQSTDGGQMLGLL